MLLHLLAGNSAATAVAWSVIGIVVMVVVMYVVLRIGSHYEARRIERLEEDEQWRRAVRRLNREDGPQ